MAVQSPDTESLQAISQQAEALVAAGKSQDAIDLLDRVSEDLSSYPALYRLKGVARLMQGSNSEARLIFEELEGSFGDDPVFLNVLGVALRRERDLGRAREVYERALEIQPDERQVPPQGGEHVREGRTVDLKDNVVDMQPVLPA